MEELSIDKSTRNVYLNKNKIELTNKEYDILCLLMKTPENQYQNKRFMKNSRALFRR